ncbi:MAG: CpsB/CapC family capsule biosynthesis tyrosine phosphatase [Desulforegulaceae bacterium]|nr:CpsB/CapC family capsule biosynthesis tyrosine phosphatase [Desulforegulaceae bacterium]
MIDIHSHILYSIDDGASNEEVSLKMAKIAVEDGITEIIATPHITEFSDWNKIFLTRNILQDKIYKTGLNLRLYLGGEVPFGMLSEGYQPVTLANSEFILVEFMHGGIKVPDNAQDIFRRFLKKGYKIIIAHPERNFFFLKNKERLKDLILPGVFLQATAMSFKGSFGKSIQLFSADLLKNEMIDFIATDAHDNVYRIPQMSFLLKSGKNKKYYKLLDKILNENPEIIFSNGK